MTIHPSKLAAARLAAAEVFIAEGLDSTNFAARGESALRRAAGDTRFSFGLSYLTGNGSIVVDVRSQDGAWVSVDLDGFYKMAPSDVADVAIHIARVAEVARKVEAAITEALR